MFGCIWLISMFVAFCCGWFLGNLGAFRNAIPHVEAVRHWFGLQRYHREMQDLVAVWSSVTHGGSSAPGTFVGMGFLALVHAWRKLSRQRTLGQQ